MEGLDWLVLGAYLAGMIALSVWLARDQSTVDDYYVGGRNLPWWALAISTMATQTSANSFIGIPAYVALKDGGGLTWLQYELAVPLAMIAVMIFLIPFFRELKLISVYEYLEMRFDRPTRLVMSGVFLLSRGLATGVGVYASAVVLSVCISLPVWACIVMIGVVTVIYDTIGGMSAVVYSDVIQMAILLVGLVVITIVAVDMGGGVEAVLATFDPARLEGIDPSHGIGDGGKAPLWGFLAGGLVLYISYYGVDQSQAQRGLSAPTIRDTKRTFVFNGVARFPLTIGYCVLGLAAGAAYQASPELRAAVPGDQLDYLIPELILQELPAGLRGLLFAAILAAAMSSLDSALNSMSASTMRDFLETRLATGDAAARAKKTLALSKVTTATWGAVIVVFAFLVGDISSTVVEGINMLGAFFYGPILAGFLAGILDRRARGPAMIAGVVAGVLANAILFATLGDSLFWMWWNVSGLVVAITVTWIGSRLMAPPAADKLEHTTIRLGDIATREREWIPTYAFLLAWFLVILAIAAYGQSLVSLLV